MTEPSPVGRLLDYDDKIPAAIDPDRVITMAKAVRLHRRIWLVASLVAAVTVTAGVGVGVLRQPSQGIAGSPRSEVDKTLAGLRKPGTPVVSVDTPVAGWQAVVYLSRDDNVCGGSVSYVDGRLSLTCWSRLSDIAGDNWLGLPAFQVLPPPAVTGNRVLVIGLMRCDADAISIDFLGQKITGRVVSLRPLDGSNPPASVYTALLPVGNATSYGTSDISSIVATSGGIATPCRLG